MAGHGGSRTVYKAGTGLAAAEAIGHERRVKRSKIRFFVIVQHGPNETTVAKRLSESGAVGLKADIERVLHGQSLV